MLTNDCGESKNQSEARTTALPGRKSKIEPETKERCLISNVPRWYNFAFCWKILESDCKIDPSVAYTCTPETEIPELSKEEREWDDKRWREALTEESPMIEETWRVIEGELIERIPFRRMKMESNLTIGSEGSSWVSHATEGELKFVKGNTTEEEFSILLSIIRVLKGKNYFQNLPN